LHNPRNIQGRNGTAAARADRPGQAEQNDRRTPEREMTRRRGLLSDPDPKFCAEHALLMIGTDTLRGLRGAGEAAPGARGISKRLARAAPEPGSTGRGGQCPDRAIH